MTIFQLQLHVSEHTISSITITIAGGIVIRPTYN